MNTILLSFVLAGAHWLDPDHDHAGVAEAIAHVVATEAPLYQGDADRRRTASLVLAIAWRESSFRNDAVSATNDHCLMQINRRPDLAEDPEECLRVGIAMIRYSMRACAEHPIATYASGLGGCENARAQRISRDRMALARRTYAAAVASLKGGM